MVRFSLLLTLMLFQTPPTGSVTGVVRSADGKPAAGVRVYAMSVLEGARAEDMPPALEGQAQTDADGRYRLAVPAGRYRIASGSVVAPTNFPAVVEVRAGALVENIDFSTFVPASRAPSGMIGVPPIPMIAIPPIPPGSTGVLSGTIRLPDGALASGIVVLAIPATVIATAGQFSIIWTRANVGLAGTPPMQYRRIVNGLDVVEGRTDNSGRYRLENVPPQTYYIVAGYAEQAAFYPGVPSETAATTIATSLRSFAMGTANRRNVCLRGRPTDKRCRRHGAAGSIVGPYSGGGRNNTSGSGNVWLGDHRHRRHVQDSIFVHDANQRLGHFLPPDR